MKKYLFVLIIQAVISISFISAQSDHMIFRNVPIDGSMTSFIQKMQNQGFTLEYNKDDGTFAKMEGTFINLNCEIFILATPQSHMVWKVAVKLPEDNDWHSLKSDYFKYKKEFQKKYGGNESSYEFFSNPYYEGDGYELQALKMGKCTYTSFFETSNGSIMVGISKLEPKVEFVYEDEINSELKNKETKDKIQDDI